MLMTTGNKAPMGLAHILYMCAARFSPEHKIPLYTEPVVYGDKFPPMNFAVEVKEGNPVNYIVEMAVAGYEKKNIHVNVNKFERTIAVECLPPTPEQMIMKAEDSGPPTARPNDVEYISKGIAARAFNKYILAPDKADLDGTKISYKDGVLKITIPALKEDPNSFVLKLEE
jgi:HSP20 family molecular chaperone IbpA